MAVRALLDTQVFLWMAAAPEALSADARRVLEASDSELFLSAASVWEISIKSGLGKLKLPEAIDAYVPDRARRLALSHLPISVTHALAVAELPDHHRDPFDRMLVAQARIELLTLVTADAALARYDVDVLRA